MQSERNYLDITLDIVLRVLYIRRTLDFYYTKQQNHSYFYKGNGRKSAIFYVYLHDVLSNEKCCINKEKNAKHGI